MGDLSEKYLLDDKVDVVGNLEINSFNGNESIQIVIKDLRKSYWARKGDVYVGI